MNIWDPGWDPLIGFLDRPAKSKPPPSRFDCLNLPKRKADEEKLNVLFDLCRRGNLRETRAIVLHSPELLPYTDRYGFTALHHAQLSRNAEFYSRLLELFNDPRTFVKKMVRYETADDLRRDSLCLHRELDADRPDGGLVTVRQVAEGSLAAWHGVVEGDYLEGVFTEAMQTKRLRKVMEELVNASRGEISAAVAFNFPVTFDFRGPACREILKESAAGLQMHAAYGLKMRKRGPHATARTRRKTAQRVQSSWPLKKVSGFPHLSMTPSLMVRESTDLEKAQRRIEQSRSVAVGTLPKSISLPAIVKPVEPDQPEADQHSSPQRHKDVPRRVHVKLPVIDKVAASQSVVAMQLDTTQQHKLVF